MRRDDEQAIRLRDAARNLGEELRARDPDRDREPDPLAHVASQARGDLGRRAGDAAHPAHVQEGLVDREPLDERRRVLEDLEHLLARLGVRAHSRRDDDGVGAQATCPPAAHRGADAVRLRLVARREHDPGADDHGAPPQPRVVPLLDRREERVDVGMQDRRLHTNICSHRLRAAPRGGPLGSRRPGASSEHLPSTPYADRAPQTAASSPAVGFSVSEG